MPNDVINPISNESSRVDHGAFDINRFNRTPEATWHASRQRSKSSRVAGSRDEQLDEVLTNAYQQYPAEESEYRRLTPEEMAEVTGRVVQTAQLLEWFRVQEMEGTN